MGTTKTIKFSLFNSLEINVSQVKLSNFQANIVKVKTYNLRSNINSIGCIWILGLHLL